MGIGDYICVTLRGAAPWGFTVAQGEGDTYRPLVVSQVEDGGCAFQAGVQESDHVVSINGEPSADLTLEQARSLIDDATDCLQLLLKRCSSAPSEDSDPDETSCGDGLETTTLHILSPKHRPPSPRDLYISESQDEASYGGMDSEGPQLLSTELHLPHQKCLESTAEDVLMTLTPGNVVELQVSVAKSTLDCADRASVEKTIDTGDAFANQETAEDAHDDPQRSSHHGVVLGAPATSRQVEVVLQGAGRGDEGARRGVGGPEIGCEGEEESQEAHEPFTVTFAAEESAATEHRDSGESEEDPDQPHKHRARHARLRRSESLSEKQVKEAKSKCKRIALLLKAAPPNPNNKGVLMFKKHRQRAKKYTLVSYGTGEEDPESRSEEEEDDQDSHAVELTIVPSKDIELTNANSSTGVLKITFDKGLLELERNLNSLVKMECDTKGKGAFMFAQRRLKMDEISAEHEELRRQGIPVDGIQEVQKKMEEHAYMQSAIEGHGYMDVNMHQQSQQQYHQYQGQQYYEQQQQQQQHHQQQQQHHQEQQQHHQQLQQHHQQHHQQQQQHYQQQNYHQQQKNYEQQQQNYQQQQYQQQYEQQYQQQQLYQQREYHQEQQQYQQYSANMNGTIQQQTNEMQSSLSNRTAKPFTAQDMTPVAYSTANGDNQESQGEQIASRDERISTPAIKTGVLLDTRRRTGGKPMFSFKDAPKVSPNPELLHLLHRGDKKLGYESGTEEDYLSLGAEACNFLQSPGFKPKIPPPVAPKPMINPNALPWAVPLEVTNQDMPQCAENSMITPAVPPPTDTTPATEVEPAPASDPPAPSAPLEAPPTSTAEEQQWSVPTDEPQPQAPQVAVAPEDRIQMNSVHQPEPSPATSWPPAQPQPQPSNSWQQAPHQVPPHSGPSPQPQWVTHQPGPVQAPQPPTNSWSPQVQQAWAQAPEQIPAQTQVQPPWAQAPEQPSSQPPVQPPWAKEQPPLQQMQPAWTQPQEQQPLTSWVQQPQQKPQVQPPWGQQVPESQPQPPWVQQPQAPTQGWPQSHGQPQPQPPWVMSQQQPSWNPQQPQTQTPWMQSGQAPPPQPQAALNPWAPVPPQPQAQQPWAQQPPEQSQQPVNAWGPEQNQPQQQHPWAQQAPPPQAPQQPANNWEQPPVKTSPQPPAQTQPPHSWAQPSQPIPVSASLVNTQPSPKPWQAPQSRSSPPPPPPQRISSFTFGQRTSSPVNPMASVLPTSAGPAYEMLAVKGKGADMFAKRQSRMEKYVVDSETVEANKASRSTSPATSLPTEWKYSPNAFGRSYSLSPPTRVPSTGQQSLPPRPRKPLTPWEAASRHPLGLVDEAFAVQDLQHTLASSVHLAAQRKILPEPPADWQARVSYQAPKKSGSQTWSQSRGHARAPLPSFVSPTKSRFPGVSGVTGYRSLPRQWQGQRSVTNLSSSDQKRPQGAPGYKSVYNSNTSWSWRR
ncbi:uncharacterized protein synpo2a isoform X2 [Eucyclogobius newberryi]|uniref:uncharacterized protein synpo2a isoform X2 n=1 Tax=Eucyclogobius newberryi TaxID=166745 RepID=UPI003B59F79D